MINAYRDDENEMAGESEYSWRMTGVVAEGQSGGELGVVDN